MNDVPLIRKTDVNDINTSLIAIKKQLRQLNEAVGLIDVPDVDLTPFVRKDEVVNVIESGNMNPVTSNAVAEYTTNEVTSGNMNPVTSNAVSQCSSYSTEEVFTGSYWIDGKPIYKKVITGLNFGSGNTGTWLNTGATIQNIETLTDCEGYRLTRTGVVHCVSKFFSFGVGSSNNIQYYMYGPLQYCDTIVAEYTKTTDTATRSIPTEETR